jgi:aspartyl-tRNA(Asn)/glutamyl-tRNA(Gln) amidotransferase subunit B
MVNILIPHYREEDVVANDVIERINNLRATYQQTKDGKLSSTNAKTLVIHVSDSVDVSEDITVVAQDKGLIQVSDESEIARIVEQVISDNPKAAEDVKNGEMKAIGFLVGQVMKVSQGKANPSLAQDLIKKQLGL